MVDPTAIQDIKVIETIKGGTQSTGLNEIRRPTAAFSRFDSLAPEAGRVIFKTISQSIQKR